MSEVGVSRLSLVPLEAAAPPERSVPHGFESYEQKIGQLVSSVVVEFKPEAQANNYLVKRKLVAVEELPLKGQENPLDTLADPELEVVSLLALGVANPRIARKLFMSEVTVSAHVAAIFGKFGIDDRLRAGLAARRAGILTRAFDETRIANHSHEPLLQATRESIGELRFSMHHDPLGLKKMLPLQRRMLELIGEGYANNELVSTLSSEGKPITLDALKARLTQIYKKIHCANRFEAGLWMDFASKGILVTRISEPAPMLRTDDVAPHVVELNQRRQQEMEETLAPIISEMLNTWADEGRIRHETRTAQVIEEDRLRYLVGQGIAPESMLRERWVNVPIAVLVHLLGMSSVAEAIRHPDWQEVAVGISQRLSEDFLEQKKI